MIPGAAVSFLTGVNGDQIVGRTWSGGIDRNVNRDPKTYPALYVTLGYGKTGIWKSTNGGVDWTNVWNNNVFKEDGVTNTFSDVGSDINGMYVTDPTNADHLICYLHGYWGTGNNSGVFESTDGGGKWVVHGTGYFTFQAHSDVAFPLSASNWFVSHGTTYPHSELYRSTDSGKTWAVIKNDFWIGGWNGAQNLRVGSVVYGEGNPMAKTTDEGATWSRLDAAGPMGTSAVTDTGYIYVTPGDQDQGATSFKIRRAKVDNDATWTDVPGPNAADDAMGSLRLRPMLALVLGCSLASSVAEAATKVACIGDSITAGAGLASPSTDAYPAVLQNLLGADYDVVNFGHSGATLLVSGDLPYIAQAEYTASNAFDPNVVVIMLGTNDSKAGNWAHASEFEGDYADLIHHYESLGAIVYAALPPPVYGSGCCWIQGSVVANEIVPQIQHVASNEKVPVIDVFTSLSKHPEDFLDGVHPTVAGDQILAHTVYDALINGSVGGARGTGGGSAQGGMGASAGQRGGGSGEGGIGASAGQRGGNGGLNQGGMPGSGGAAGDGTFGSGGSGDVNGSGGSDTGGAPGGATSQSGDASSSNCSCQLPPRVGSEGAWGLLWFAALAARRRHRRATDSVAAAHHSCAARRRGAA